MKRSVAVIGGGVSGLMSAKELLSNGYRVVLFETRDFLGGAWRARPTNAAGVPSMWKTLRPNLSKYTCAFPDFPWPKGTDLYPSMDVFNQYIDDFTESHILNNDSCDILLNASVKKIKRTNDQITDNFSIEWSNGNDVSTSVFDAVVVASGYFNTPVYPACISKLKNKERIVHSSYFREPKDFENMKVAVIGGAYSGHEVSASVAAYAKHVVNISGYKNYYVLPRYLPGLEGNFVPNDFTLFQRHKDAFSSELSSVSTPEECQMKHKFFQNLLGKKKVNQLVSKGYEYNTSEPPFMTVSDMYFNLLESGNVSLKRVRLKGCFENENKKLRVLLENGETIDDIDKIICCTGYKSDLSFLSDDILEALKYDANDTFLPMTTVLDVYQPSVRKLGFVGMYRGPYFGVKYLQANLFIQQCLQEKGVLSDDDEKYFLDQTQHIRDSNPKPQSPRIDYVGLADVLAEKVSLLPRKEVLQAGEVCLPQYYTGDAKLAEDTWKEVVLQRKDTEFNTLAIFEGLIGSWNFERTKEDGSNQKIAHSSGHATFSVFSQIEEYCIRYHEISKINGIDEEKSECYDYLFHKDRIDIYYVENNERKDYLFSLTFNLNKGVWETKTTEFLFKKDQHINSCTLKMDGLSIQEFKMINEVIGPEAKYKSTTIYQ